MVYTMDWNRCLDILTKRIGGIQICPLIPVIKDYIPGSLATNLIALVSWLTKQYEGSTLSLLSVWSLLAGIVTDLTTLGCPPLQSRCWLPLDHAQIEMYQLVSRPKGVMQRRLTSSCRPFSQLLRAILASTATPGRSS